MDTFSLFFLLHTQLFGCWSGPVEGRLFGLTMSVCAYLQLLFKHFSQHQIQTKTFTASCNLMYFHCNPASGVLLRAADVGEDADTWTLTCGYQNKSWNGTAATSYLHHSPCGSLLPRWWIVPFLPRWITAQPSVSSTVKCSPADVIFGVMHPASSDLQWRFPNWLTWLVLCCLMCKNTIWINSSVLDLIYVHNYWNY